MNSLRLILRNLWYFRKQYLALLGGAVISIAVLTGALVVGDSVRLSLQKLTDTRLGKTRFVLQSGEHLFRQQLAEDLSREIREPVAPLLVTEGIAVNSEKNIRINRAGVIGIDDRFPDFWNSAVLTPGEDEALVSANVAAKLDLVAGDEFLVRVRKESGAQENAPFSAEKDISVPLRLKVKAVLPDDTMGRFSLRSNQSAPFNIFISIEQLNHLLELKNKANLLLISAETSKRGGKILPSPAGEGPGVRLSEELGVRSAGDTGVQSAFQPEDLGLKIRKTGTGNQYEITSDRIFMDDAVSGAITSSIPGCSSIFTYLANSLETGIRSTPYSFVTAADSLFLGRTLNSREMILNEWLAGDLQAKAGDSVTMIFYEMGPMMTLKEKSARFVVKGIIPMNSPLCDPSLMPRFPGMTGAGNCRDWETATPVDMKRIRDKDEDYWKEYRGTPKAFISLVAGRELWKNRFGTVTAFRFTTGEYRLKEYEKAIMDKLDPAAAGLQIIPVYENGLRSAANATDFGDLFLGLSFVIIFSGLLLMGMIFSVHTNSRLAEAGTLSALGFRKKQITRILAGEASVVVLLGGLLGSAAGIGYNMLMLLGLNTLWQDSVRTTSLEMHLTSDTLLMGAFSGMIVAMIILLAILSLRLRNPLVSLLSYFPMNPSRKRKEKEINNRFPGFFPLVIRNAWINRRRTLSAILLLALGVFMVVITGMNRKIFQEDTTTRQSGTGGFLLWAETTIPVRFDLNTPEGKKQAGLADDSLFRDTRFLQVTRLKGEDASCLNLNRASQPVLMGIDAGYLDSISAFGFTGTLPSPDQDRPWKMLEKPLSDKVIPGIADATVIKWGLGLQLGDTLVYTDEAGRPLKVRLVGELDNSVFQGNILVSDSLMRIFFPSVAGSDVLLVDGPIRKRDLVAAFLERQFTDQGMMVTSTAKRLDEFNSVQNTYLSVFMLLGGMGVVIGTFGLGFLLLRNIQSRRHEIALYSALGFTRTFITRLLVAEHLFLLISGILLGLILALVAGIPLLLSGPSAVPVLFLLVLLVLIFFSGFLWIFFPVRNAVKKDLTGILRKE